MARLISAFLGLFLVALAAADDKTTVTEYSWLTEDRITGSQRVSAAGDGTITIHFEYTDRGRGPRFESALKLDQNGFPTEFSASGHNNTKAVIEEQFLLLDDTATWSSSVEQGRRKLSESEFYLPFNDSPEIRAILARALLKNPDRSVALLPGGRASIEALGSAHVARDQETREVTLYGINGIDIEPAFVWLDENGDLFGFHQKYFGVVRKGWEPSLARLKEVERVTKDRFYEDMASELTRELSGLVVIAGARIFDSISGRITDPATVFVWEGTISAIYYNQTDIPAGATVIDGAGKTLMPSLWDMHNHVVPAFLPEYLAFGITNVRDLGNNHDSLQHLIDNIRDNRFAGPDIHPLGFIDKRGEFAAPVGLLADSLHEAIGIVDFYARHGYRGIKLYSAIEPDWIEPLAYAAHERGLPVTGHIPAFMSARQAIDAGFNEIAHINQFLLAFLGGEKLDTRGPARFLVPGEQTADLDLNSEEVNGFISFMKEREIALDTTLAPIMEMFRNRPGELSPIYSDVADYIPQFLRRTLVMSEGYNQGREEAFSRSSETILRIIAKAHEAGITLLPGTDNLLPGFTLIRELIYYTEAGIPANEVLQLGTIVPARHMGLDHRLGSISVHKDAHMYLVDGNPTENITDLYRVEHIFKGRKLYYGPDLLRALGLVPLVD